MVNSFVSIASVLALLGFAAALMTLMRRTQERTERKKAVAARAERARMTYDDFGKEYRKAFDALEKKGWCVLDVIHDLSDEWQAKDGAHQYISYEEAFYLCEKIRRSKRSPLLLVLHTLGGYSFPSEMIACRSPIRPASGCTIRIPPKCLASCSAASRASPIAR